MRKTIATVGKCGRMGGRLRHAAAWAAVALLLWTLCAPRMAMAEVTPTGAVAPSPDGQVTPLPGGEGDVEEAATSTDSPAPTGTASPQSSPAPTETLRRADNPLITPLRYQPLPTDGQAAFKDTLNILLLGFDAEYKFYAQDGGDSHTDAMMLLSVNTKTNAITLISLPRDTLTYVPGVRGIYKLNGAINAGGGKTAAGFRCAVEAASVLLGNIPIDYYIGLDMEKVAELGDLLGGVDVEVTIAFTTESGRRITPGMKHLDGEAMYSYMRARKSAEGTDKGRTKRQRAVISAMLQKVKGEQLYLRIPQMMAAMQDGVYTDMTAEALSFAGERLMELGALDVSFAPVTMKKGRPGTVFTVLCRPQDEAKLSEAVLRETSSNGVRARRCQKYILTPSKKSVETPYGPIAVKCAEGFGISHAKPEYDAVAALAKKTGLPFHTIWEAALAAIEQSKG